MDFGSLLKSEQYDFLRNKPQLGKRIMLLTLGGSYSYGTNREGSDIDIRGITAEFPECIIGTHEFEQFDDSGTDTVIFGFNKFFKLLYGSNPNSLEMLGTRPEHVFYMSPAGKLLRENRKLFISQQSQYPYTGFARSQLNRLRSMLARNSNQEERIQEHILESLNSRLRLDLGSFKPVSSDEAIVRMQDGELVMDINLTGYPLKDMTALQGECSSMYKNYHKPKDKGKDELHVNKHAAHLVRLYYTAIDLMEKGDIIVYREKEHDLLASIIRGDYMVDNWNFREEFFELVEDLEKQLAYAIANTSLPPKHDEKKLEELKMEVNSMILKGEF